MTIAETVARLDYSKPPPEYTVEEIPAIERASPRDPRWRTCTAGAFAERHTPDEALAVAWIHYRNRNDPPGVETVPTMGQGAAFVMPGSPLWGDRVAIVLPWVDKYPSARAAAWAWHDHRHALAERGLAYRGRGWAALAVWPRCLTWTDEQVAEVERWLANSTAEMPEVLR